MVKPSRTQKKRIGAAMLEAVIILPVFILIFAGIRYVESLWENRQQALLRARTCAWLYANTGCDHEKLPPNCNGVLRDANGLTESNALAESMNGGVLDGLTEVPLIGPVVESLFASAFRSRSSRQIQRTHMLGEKTVAVVGDYYLMCNERKRNMLDLIKDAFCSTAGDVLGCS